MMKLLSKMLGCDREDAPSEEMIDLKWYVVCELLRNQYPIKVDKFLKRQVVGIF